MDKMLKFVLVGLSAMTGCTIAPTIAATRDMQSRFSREPANGRFSWEQAHTSCLVHRIALADRRDRSIAYSERHRRWL
jgi:hypothetical protein